MSYFEIGVYQPKFEDNIGTLMRSAYIMGASGIFSIGTSYIKSKSNTCKAERHIPYRVYNEFSELIKNKPLSAKLVAIETGGRKLNNYCHPKQCIYILGSEAIGLPSEILDRCDDIISVDSIFNISYNVAVAGSIVMHHRLIQTNQKRILI